MKVLCTFFIILFCSLENGLSYDVLFVTGGMFIDQGIHYTHRSAEAIGLNRVCSNIAPLPTPLHSHFSGRLRDRLIVCGGNDGVFERHECYSYFPSNDSWIQGPRDLEGGNLIFAAATGDNLDKFYVVGGRNFSHDVSSWRYQNKSRVLDIRTNHWRSLPDLPSPIADACLLTLNGALFLIGGSKDQYRYANDPSKVWVLLRNENSWRDDIVPPLIGARMWPGCTLANIHGEISLLVAGGYYNGRTGLTFPLTNFLTGNYYASSRDRWSYVGTLSNERQWGPALGLVAGIPTIATGKNYGDHTIEELSDNDYWQPESRRRLHHKREFSSYATVPHYWFPQCF